MHLLLISKINNNENIEYLNQNNVSPLICRVNDLFINGKIMIVENTLKMFVNLMSSIKM